MYLHVEDKDDSVQTQGLSVLISGWKLKAIFEHGANELAWVLSSSPVSAVLYSGDSSLPLLILAVNNDQQKKKLHSASHQQPSPGCEV